MTQEFAGLVTRDQINDLYFLVRFKNSQGLVNLYRVAVSLVDDGFGSQHPSDTVMGREFVRDMLAFKAGELKMQNNDILTTYQGVNPGPRGKARLHYWKQGHVEEFGVYREHYGHSSSEQWARFSDVAVIGPKILGANYDQGDVAFVENQAFEYDQAALLEALRMAYEQAARYGDVFERLPADQLPPINTTDTSEV